MSSRLEFAARRSVGRALPVAALATAVGLAGCGSSGSSSSASSGSTGVAAGAAGTAPATAAGSSTGTGGSNWFVTGTYKGQALQGPVTLGRVMCTPISVGGSSGVQVIWGGTFDDNATGKSGQISGDMSFPQFGSWTIPTTDPHTPVASLVVAGDYANRYGLSSGPGGLGSGNLTATAASGTVDAMYSTGSDTLSLKGSWTCG